MASRIFPRLRRNHPRSLVPYAGQVGAERSWTGARVLADRPLPVPAEDDGFLEDLKANWSRWETSELKGVEVEARLGGQSLKALSDVEGHVSFRFPAEVVPARGGWYPVHLRITHRADGKALEQPLEAETAVIRPAPDARYAVLSDIDDTILHTGATSLLTMARLTFLGNARTRKPLLGVAALYRALQAGAARPEQAEETTEGDCPGDPVKNPIVYISSSPWNLYDLLNDFMRINAIPRGPLLLRDYGLRRYEDTGGAGSHGHKLVKARQMVETWPSLPFILFGDSGQHDAELYATLAEEKPDRIMAIFIRDVDPGSATDRDEGVRGHIRRAEKAGVPMFLVEDSLVAGRHAVELGLLSPEALPGIAAVVEKDKARPAADG